MAQRLSVGLPAVWDLLKAVVLGTLQGLTEFLPISSSAHLRIFPELFGWGDPGAAFTAVVQIGTELAVLIYFRKDIWRIGSTWLRSLWRPELRGHLDSRMGWFIIIGSLPIVVLGVIFKDTIENDFRNLWIIGTTLIVLGVVLGVADRIGRNDRAATIATKRVFRAPREAHPAVDLDEQAVLFESPEKHRRMTEFLERKTKR